MLIWRNITKARRYIMKDNIPGFMGYYVSKTGSVYSRYVRGSRGKLSNEFTPLIPKKRPKYYSVSLYRMVSLQRFLFTD